MALAGMLAAGLHCLLHLLHGFTTSFNQYIEILWPSNIYKLLEGRIKNILLDDFIRIKDSLPEKRPHSVAVILGDELADVEIEFVLNLVRWLGSAQVETVAVYDSQGIVQSWAEELEQLLRAVHLSAKGQQLHFEVKVIGSQEAHASTGDLSSRLPLSGSSKTFASDDLASSDRTALQGPSEVDLVTIRLFPEQAATGLTNGCHESQQNYSSAGGHYETTVPDAGSHGLKPADSVDDRLDRKSNGHSLRHRGKNKLHITHTSYGAAEHSSLGNGELDGSSVTLGNGICSAEQKRTIRQQEVEFRTVQVALLSADNGKEALARAAQEICRRALKEEMGPCSSQTEASESSLAPAPGEDGWREANGGQFRESQARSRAPGGQHGGGDRGGDESSIGECTCCSTSERELQKCWKGERRRNGETGEHYVAGGEGPMRGSRELQVGTSWKANGTLEDGRLEAKTLNRGGGESRGRRDGEGKAGSGGSMEGLAREGSGTTATGEGQKESPTASDWRDLGEGNEASRFRSQQGTNGQTRKSTAGVVRGGKGSWRKGGCSNGEIMEVDLDDEMSRSSTETGSLAMGGALKAEKKAKRVKLREDDVDQVLKEIGAYWDEPELILVFGKIFTLDGFPPWSTRLSEMRFMGPLKSLHLSSFLQALWHYAGTTQRLGR